ncbi:MAG TPA: DUF134 domain-containing protein [Bacteroidales bacterium]|nr:DUF134 domain-containing protein [Bacteroidales bacterium]
MSPRPFKLRKISNPPVISGLKPYGKKAGSEPVQSIFLNLEEYEAIRLCDFEMLNHIQASLIMNVSRPTLTRIYSRARQKIAEALVLGKQIIIEGGKIYFDSDWYTCNTCGCNFNNPEKQEEIKACPLCSGTDFKNFEPYKNRIEDTNRRCSEVCLCTSCGHESPHQLGQPCREEICPECGSKMVRKETENF